MTVKKQVSGYNIFLLIKIKYARCINSYLLKVAISSHFQILTKLILHLVFTNYRHVYSINFTKDSKWMQLITLD